MPTQRMKLDNRTGDLTASSFSETRAPFSRSMIHHDFSMMNAMLNSNTPVQSQSIFKPLVYIAERNCASLTDNYPSAFDCDLNQPSSWKNEMEKYYNPLEESFTISNESIFNQCNIAFPIVPELKMYFEFDLMLVEGDVASVHFGGVYLDQSYNLIDDPALYCPVGSYDWTGSNGKVEGAIIGEWVTCKNLYINGEPKTGIGSGESNWKHPSMKFFQPIIMINEGSPLSVVKIRNIRIWYESDTPVDPTYKTKYGFYVGKTSTNLLEKNTTWEMKNKISSILGSMEVETLFDYEGNKEYSIRTYKNFNQVKVDNSLILYSKIVNPNSTYTNGLNSWISDKEKFSYNNYKLSFIDSAGLEISSQFLSDTLVVDEDKMIYSTFTTPPGCTKVELRFVVVTSNLGCRFFISNLYLVEGRSVSFAPVATTISTKTLHYGSLGLSNSFTHFFRFYVINEEEGVVMKLQDTYGKNVSVSIDSTGKVVLRLDPNSLMNSSNRARTITTRDSVVSGSEVTILLRKDKEVCLAQCKIRGSVLESLDSSGEVTSHYHSDLYIGDETNPPSVFFLSATMMIPHEIPRESLNSMHDLVGCLSDILVHRNFSESTQFDGYTEVNMDKYSHNSYGTGYITRSESKNVIRTSCPLIRKPGRWQDIRPFTQNNATPYGLGYTYLSGSLTKEFNDNAYGPTWMYYDTHPSEEGKYLLLSGWIHCTSDCDLEEVGFFIEGHEKSVDLRVYDLSRSGEYQFCFIKVILGSKPVKIMTSPKSKTTSPEFQGSCTFSGMNIVVSESEGLLPGASPTNASTVDKFRFKLHREYGIQFNEDWTIYYRKTPICGCNNTEKGALIDYLGDSGNYLVWGKDEEVNYIIGAGPVDLKSYWMVNRDIMISYNSKEKKVYFYEYSDSKLWSRVIVKDILSPDEFVRADGTDLILGGTTIESHGAIISNLMVSQRYTSGNEFNIMSRERGTFGKKFLLANEFIEV